MRLLVDCHCFDYGESQGINTYIRELYKALIPIAGDITFVFAAHNINRLSSIFGKGDNIEYIELGNHNKYYRLAIEFPRIIKKLNIDWAHFQYISPLIKNCKTIVTLHDILFEDFPKEFPLSYRLSKHILFSNSAKKADILLTVSDYSRERISNIYSIPINNIYVTHNGVSEEYKRTNQQEAKEFIQRNHGIDKYILYVSRFEPRKNQHMLLNVYKKLNLNELGFELVFIGIKSIQYSEFDDALNSCNQNVRNHVHIFENLPYRELKNWYAGASLFVYPSKAEGFGIPPLEAAACKVPVICNNQTAMRDFDFLGRYHIATDNEQKLETMILSEINKSSEMTTLNNIQNTIYDRYSWNLIAVNFYRYLQKIID